VITGALLSSPLDSGAVRLGRGSLIFVREVLHRRYDLACSGSCRPHPSHVAPIAIDAKSRVRRDAASQLEGARRLAFILTRADHLLRDQAAPALRLTHEREDRPTIDLHGDPIRPEPHNPAPPPDELLDPEEERYGGREENADLRRFTAPFNVLRYRP
jgi:hypothetical protein